MNGTVISTALLILPPLEADKIPVADLEEDLDVLKALGLHQDHINDAEEQLDQVRVQHEAPGTDAMSQWSSIIGQEL